MSGGHFDYIQYRFDDVASSIEKEIATGEYEPAIVTRFQLAADTVRLAGKMIQRVDWLVSDDDGPDSFLTRWHDDGLPVPGTTTLTTENAALAARVEALEGALRYVAEHRPIFDYVAGADWDQPGSPYDRGRQDEARFLADHVRAALAGDPS